MMIRSPVLRTISLINRRVFNAGSALEKAYLDPSKHIYMNHFPHYVYVEYWPIGQYPQTYTIGSVSPKTYQPQVEKILIQTLNAKYNKQFKLQDIVSQNLNKFFTNVLKTQQNPLSFFEVVLPKLASSIFVKESSWTWVKEQQIRASNASRLTFYQDVNTFGQFLNAYNSTIEHLVIMSNFGLSKNIEQDETAQQKHLYAQLDVEAQGISELREERPQNKSAINKFMSLIHSL